MQGLQMPTAAGVLMIRHDTETWHIQQSFIRSDERQIKHLGRRYQETVRRVSMAKKRRSQFMRDRPIKRRFEKDQVFLDFKNHSPKSLLSRIRFLSSSITISQTLTGERNRSFSCPAIARATSEVSLYGSSELQIQM